MDALAVHHLTVAGVANALAVSWSTANAAVLPEGQRVLLADPARFDLFVVRQVLHTGIKLLTQRTKLEALFNATAQGDAHAEVGRRALETLIETLTKYVPAELIELARLGRTLTLRAEDVPAL